MNAFFNKSEHTDSKLFPNGTVPQTTCFGKFINVFLSSSTSQDLPLVLVVEEWASQASLQEDQEVQVDPVDNCHQAFCAFLPSGAALRPYVANTCLLHSAWEQLQYLRPQNAHVDTDILEEKKKHHTSSPSSSAPPLHVFSSTLPFASASSSFPLGSSWLGC